MRKKNKYTPAVPEAKRKEIFNYWLQNPNTKNAELAVKFDLTGKSITNMLTEQLQQCKQK